MSKQKKATEKEPPASEEGEESDGSVPATTVRELMHDQQKLMKEQQESQWQILMEIIKQQWVEMAKHRVKMRELLAWGRCR